MQRTSGNRAVARMLAREKTETDETQPAAPQETGIADSAATGRMTTAAKQVQADWDALKTADARAQKFAEAPLAELKAAGVPAYTVVMKDLGSANGQFDFTTWSMDLAKGRFETAKPSAAVMAGVARTIAHESRHCEQWFRMARLEAGRGKKAAAIAKKLQIPQKIADEAEKNPLKADTPEGKEAEAWYESVYGGKGADRGKVLKALPVLGKALADAKAATAALPATASQAEKDAAKAKQDEAQKAYDENYAKYRALPEEADAFNVGGTVEAGVLKP